MVNLTSSRMSFELFLAGTVRWKMRRTSLVDIFWFGGRQICNERGFRPNWKRETVYGCLKVRLEIGANGIS